MSRKQPAHAERIKVTDQEVRYVTELIRTAGPHARVVYDVETGASPEVDAMFGGKGALQPYAGAYLTGFSVAVVQPSVWGADDATLYGYYLPLGHEDGNISHRGRMMLTEALAQTEATHVGFNTPFDWAFLLNEGLLLDTPRKAHDVQIKRWLHDENGIKALKLLGEMWLGENASREQKALKEMMRPECRTITEARKQVLDEHPELGLVMKGGRVSTARCNEEGEALAQELRHARTWAELTPEELGPYAARDATLTAQLDRLLDGVSPEATIAREMAVNAVCIDMTRKGAAVSHERLRAVVGLYSARAEEVRKGLLEEHALENPGSGPQVAALLYDRLGLPIRGRTKSGEPSTDKNALEQLAGDPVAGQVLAYRKWDHALSYAKSMLKYAEASSDGKLHGMYGTTRTVTGRLASSNPNVMNIPREESLPELREAFNIEPAPGHTRYGFDLASAELWVTASVTGDPVLTSVLLEGRNLHVEMMVQVFGGEPDKHRREYTLSKNVNYGIEYGAGLDQITIFAAKAGYSPAEARRVAQVARDGHKRLFSRQHHMADWWARQAEELGALPLAPEGRYRHFKSPGHFPRYYTALNALVQGGVAEFMKDTMIEVYRRGYGELLVLQVHDELVFDAPTGMELELLAVLQQISHDVNPFRYELRWDAKSWG